MSILQPELPPQQPSIIMSANFIDTVDALTRMVDDIVSTTTTPFIFVDLEGIDLSRHGSISILQLLIPPTPVVHLVDIFRMQGHAFESPGTKDKTLKDILESDQYVKVFFDVRNDSDALFSHFGVDLKGVLDLQLVEYASRPTAGRLIKGLAKCISEDHQMGCTESRKWTQVKEAGQKLFAPERGGAYAVFNERPLPEALRDYCVQDVMILPKLLVGYANRLQPHMAVQVIDESSKRVLQSQAAHFNGQGRHMALAPSFRWSRCVFPMSFRWPSLTQLQGVVRTDVEISIRHSLLISSAQLLYVGRCQARFGHKGECTSRSPPTIWLISV